ncbi:MAG TPA: FHA domain-containing protein [Ktedonobacterales bacterium]|jgi:predicted lipoprotein with Yx(FWY)xxD motif
MSATLRGPSGLIYLDHDVLTIGRSRQNRLVFTHSQVSSKHAEIQPLGDGRYQVVDVGSSNGTLVNGLRLSGGTPHVLSEGDTLRLGGAGGIELVFAWAAAPAVLEAPAPMPVGVLPAFPPVRPAPAPAPLPAAITNVARYKRPPKVLLLGGSLLVLVLLISGIALGGKLLGSQSPKRADPVAIGDSPPTPADTPTPTPTPTPTSAPAPAVVQTAQATVEGQETTILTNAQGLTLYYFKPDTPDKTACTGACIANWPPLLFDGPGDPTASSELSGTLSIQTSENGAQVAYNGHPLYTFSGDSAPGQTNGEGKAGKWFVATADLEANG